MKHYLLFALAFIGFTLPMLVFADDLVFTPLTGLPGTESISGSDSLAAFFNTLYRLCVGVAASLAVLQIIRSGFEWMRGDSVSGTKEARGRIVSSLLGLLLVLAPAIVFGLIDPRILSLRLDASGLNIGDVSPFSGRDSRFDRQDGGPNEGACASIANGSFLRNDAEITCCSALPNCQVNRSVNGTLCQCDRGESPEPPQPRGYDNRFDYPSNSYLFIARTLVTETRSTGNTYCAVLWGGATQTRSSCENYAEEIQTRAGGGEGYRVLHNCDYRRDGGAITFTDTCADQPYIRWQH